MQTWLHISMIIVFLISSYVPVATRGGIFIPTAWGEDRMRFHEISTPRLREQASQEERPPLYFDLQPSFIRNGQSIRLIWDFTEEAAARAETGKLSLRIEYPPALTPVEKTAQRGVLQFPLEQAQGEVTFTGGLCETDQVEVKISVLVEEIVRETRVLRAACDATQVSASRGGLASGLGERVRVEFPAEALDGAIDVAILPLDDSDPISASSTAFKIEAFDAAGEEVRQFKAEFQIHYVYDSSRYEGNESAIRLTYLDETTGEWVGVPTRVDIATHTLSATTDHLTIYDPTITDFQGAQLPLLENFQVNGQSGAATWSLPLNLPASSPGNPVPSLTLSYNSQAVDNGTAEQQASWVGMGWNLGLPTIERDMHGTMDSPYDDSFSLNLNGVGGRLVKDTDGNWRLADSDAFYKITFTGPRPNELFAYNDPETTTGGVWTVTDKQGVTYEFSEFALVPICKFMWTDYYYQLITPWRWALTRITTPLNAGGQNVVAISYQRTVATVKSTGHPNCESNPVVMDQDLYPAVITYPNQKYRVVFNTAARLDYKWEWANSLDPSEKRKMFSRNRLASVEVDWNNGTAWQKIREYVFTYASELGSPSESNRYVYPGIWWTAGSGDWNRTLTLRKVQEKNYNPDDAARNVIQPAVEFVYGDTMHLTQVITGQGGEVEFTYQPWSPVLDLYPSGYPSFWWKSTATEQFDTYTQQSLHCCGLAVFSPGKNIDVLFEARNDSGYSNVTLRFGLYSVGYNLWMNDESGQPVWRTLPLPANRGWTTVSAAGQGANNATFRLPATLVTYGNYHVRKTCSDDRAWCVSRNSVYRVLPTYYRVTNKTYRDLVSGQNRAYGYSYTDAAGNDTAAMETDPAEGRYVPRYVTFLGHTTVTETKPDGSKTTTEYYPYDNGLPVESHTAGRALHGLPVKVTRKTASGNLLSVTAYTYDYTGLSTPTVTTRQQNGLPYQMIHHIWWPRVTSVTTLVYDGTTTSETTPKRLGTKTEYTYDLTPGAQSTGNLLKTIEYVLDPSDNATWIPRIATASEYYPNFTNNLNGLPARVYTYRCDGQAGCPLTNGPAQLLSDTRTLYGGNTVYNAAPSLGVVRGTKTAVRYDTANSRWVYLDAGETVDSWGNVTERWVNLGESLEGQFLENDKRVLEQACYAGSVGSQDCPLDLNYVTLPRWVRNGLGHETAFAYYLPLGQPTAETQANGAVTQYSLDAAGRLLALVKPGDSTGSPTFTAAYSDYASPAQPFSQTATQKIDDPNGTRRSVQATQYADGFGQVVQVQQDGVEVGGLIRDVVVDRGYDAATRTSWESKPYAAQSVGYLVLANRPLPESGYKTTTLSDEQGRTLSVSQANQNVQTWAYTIETAQVGLYPAQALLKTVSKNPNQNGGGSGQSVTWTNNLGQVIRVDAASGPGVNYAYDPAGHLVWAETGGAETNIQYDFLGRKVEMDDPDMGLWSYGYDLLGNLTRQTDALGQTACLYYDGLNRLVGKTYRQDINCPADPGYSGYAVQYYYDEDAAIAPTLGRRTRMVDASGEASWSYDERGRVTGETRVVNGAGTYTLGYAYNSADQVTALTYPNGEVVVSATNPQGALDGLTSQDGTKYLRRVLYDAAGRATDMWLGGSGETAAIQRELGYYAWDAAVQGGRLESLSAAGTGPLQALSYGYDRNGNIIEMTDEVVEGGQAVADTLSFSYDTLDRLTTMQVTRGSTTTHSESFVYGTDGLMATKTMNGNTQTMSYDPNHPHAVSGYGTNTYAYDANGNQVGRTAGGLTTTYTYDTENRMVEVSGAASASYVYDGDGVLVKALSAEGTTVYVGGVFEAFIPNEEPEPTATPTTSPTPTATPPAGNNPTTPVLDDFNRADGAIGSGWSGTTGAYTLSGNELRSSGAGVIFWGGESFGANQEAYYTVGSLETNTRIRLVLKSQSNTNYANGLLFVDYHTSAGSVKVMTFTTEQSYVQRGSTVYTTFTAGDLLWAKADSSGQVTVYKNGDLLTTVDVSAWPYYANGGYIGIWTSNVQTGTTFDDFGGGTLPTAFRLGDALAALWQDFTGWLGKAFKAQPVQASVSLTISAPPVGEVWKNYVFAGSARIAVRTFANGSTTGTVTFLIADHLGSLSAVADMNGNLVGQMRYTAFGEVRMGQVGVTKHTYTGQLSQMEEVGLIFYRARWLDPYLNRWIQPDGIIPDPFNPQDRDRYSYVRNNPINFIDPSGHMPTCDTESGGCGEGTIVNDTVLFYLSGLGGHDIEPSVFRTAAGEYQYLYYSLQQLVGPDNFVYIPLFKNYDKVKSHLEMAEEAWGSKKPQTNFVVSIIEDYVSENPDKRIVIVGSSAGGTVAIEALDILETKGIFVDQVILRGSFVSEPILQNVGSVDYIAADPPISDRWYSFDTNPFDRVQVQEHIVKGFSGHVPPNAHVLQQMRDAIYLAFFSARR